MAHPGPSLNLPLVTADFKSLDFVVNRFLMKLFKTSNVDIINYCHLAFNLDLPSVFVANYTVKFEAKFTNLENAFCQYI